ncbi:hypothetical protein BROUX41_000554 [Berkeleyomyces rouxiae]|uniref:uncharacterized protein n=1 Tax=Berkeleyomyces rouxiae TaxID=2035830 RepID=UPI003B7C11C5
MSTPPMDIDDDDLYSDEGDATTINTTTAAKTDQPTNEQPMADSTSAPKGDSDDSAEDKGDQNDEEGDEDEDEDSDIDIIIDRQDGGSQDTAQQLRPVDSRAIPQRSASDIASGKAPATDNEPDSSMNPAVAVPTHFPSQNDISSTGATSSASAPAPLPVPSTDSEAQATSSSKLNINGNPVYAPAGKPIMSVVIDTDLNENEKPWRQPGTDLSDYFNYGFDEFTWALYAAKQESIRNEFSADALMANQKKMMEEFNNMMMGGMGGGMPGGGMPGVAGMDPSMMPPEMQQMMQQMMAGGGGAGMGGMDMSQMDTSMFNAGGNIGNGAATSIGPGGNNNDVQGGVSGNQEGFNANGGTGQFGGMQGGDFGGYNRGGGFMGRGRGGRRHW